MREREHSNSTFFAFILVTLILDIAVLGWELPHYDERRDALSPHVRHDGEEDHEEIDLLDPVPGSAEVVRDIDAEL